MYKVTAQASAASILTMLRSPMMAGMLLQCRECRNLKYLNVQRRASHWAAGRLKSAPFAQHVVQDHIVNPPLQYVLAPQTRRLEGEANGYGKKRLGITETATSGRRWRRSYIASEQRYAALMPGLPGHRGPRQAKEHEIEGCLLRRAQLTGSHVDDADHKSLARKGGLLEGRKKSVSSLRPPSPGRPASRAKACNAMPHGSRLFGGPLLQGSLLCCILALRTQQIGKKAALVARAQDQLHRSRTRTPGVH